MGQMRRKALCQLRRVAIRIDFNQLHPEPESVFELEETTGCAGLESIAEPLQQVQA